jgi:hypothetical protein
VTVSLPLILVVLYFTANIAMARRLGGGDNIGMGYEHQWQVEIFKPVALMESQDNAKYYKSIGDSR